MLLLLRSIYGYSLGQEQHFMGSEFLVSGSSCVEWPALLLCYGKEGNRAETVLGRRSTLSHSPGSTELFLPHFPPKAPDAFVSCPFGTAIHADGCSLHLTLQHQEQGTKQAQILSALCTYVSGSMTLTQPVWLPPEGWQVIPAHLLPWTWEDACLVHSVSWISCL